MLTKQTEYRDVIHAAIKQRTGSILLASTTDHISSLLCEVFVAANLRIRILTERLPPEIFARASVCDAAQFYLADPQHHLDVLVEADLWDPGRNFLWKAHPFFQRLISDRSMCSRLTAGVVPGKYSSRFQYNFIVIDDYGYALQQDRSRLAMSIAFLPKQEATSTERLIKIFSELQSMAIPII